MATSEVVSSVFLAADELLGVEELAVGSGPHLVDDGGLQIHEHGTRNVLSGAGLAEERVEGVVSSTDRLVARHLTIRLPKRKSQTFPDQKQPPLTEKRKGKGMYLNAMLEAVEFPAGVSDLNTGLTDVNRNALSHFPEKKK